MSRVVAVALLLAVVVAPLAAAAHAFLVKSSPARRAMVTSPPARVELEFNERLEPAYSTLSVWNDAGAQVDAGNAAVDGDPRRLVVAVPPLPPGRYT
ncbi:MAG: copper resistance CopC family protein, partial [Candidatus Rokuibacteriota bacterium]